SLTRRDSGSAGVERRPVVGGQVEELQTHPGEPVLAGPARDAHDPALRPDGRSNSMSNTSPTSNRTSARRKVPPQETSMDEKRIGLRTLRAASVTSTETSRSTRRNLRVSRPAGPRIMA